MSDGLQTPVCRTSDPDLHTPPVSGENARRHSLGVRRIGWHGICQNPFRAEHTTRRPLDRPDPHQRAVQHWRTTGSLVEDGAAVAPWAVASVVLLVGACWDPLVRGAQADFILVGLAGYEMVIGLTEE